MWSRCVERCLFLCQFQGSSWAQSQFSLFGCFRATCKYWKKQPRYACEGLMLYFLQLDNGAILILCELRQSRVRVVLWPSFCAVLRRFTFVQNIFPLVSSRGCFSKPKRLLEGSNFQSSNVIERTRSMVPMISDCMF
jgi:hypothetical protein